MARYDYDCPGCGVVELEHSMSANREEQVCPVCGSDVEPLIAGVQLSARAEFKPYKLENGQLSKVENDPYFDDGKVSGKRGIYIQSKRHETSVLDRMDCRFADIGEPLAGGGKYGDKPDKPVHIRR